MTDHPGLHLGARLDPDSGDRLPDPLTLEAESLTTHGVIVGMTGSGKTGLGIVLLEEILDSGRPALLLDPKGDLANLLLLFPELRPADFRPWIDPAEARRAGITEDELATRTAETWRKGLAGWGIDGERIRRLRDRVSLRVYTPGSTAGAPLNLVGSLAPPGGDEEARHDAAEGIVSGILTLAGIESDPLTSPEHILLANLVEHAWSEGRTLELETLIAGIQSPPFRKLGVFDVDAFVPPDRRMKLALRLNGLLASPSFAAWRRGDPLEIDTLLRAPDGRPRASVVQLAHLSDAERMFVATLLLSRSVSWMRSQPGTSDLRALIYVDELFGFAPPTAQPPSKKPLLTLFKQARAHGLGVVVSTQNPVDVDYKLMSNAGTWMVGRLQTERDKARILEALRSADGSVDVTAWDARIGALGKRQFVLKTTRSADPVLFTTRWAMAYLRGPVTEAELASLPEAAVGAGVAGDDAAAASDAASTEPRPAAEDARPSSGERGPAASAPSPADDESPVQPPVAGGVTVRWLDPGAPWAGSVGAGGPGPRLEPGVALRVNLLFDETRADLRHEEVWEAVVFPLTGGFDPSRARAVDHDPRDFRDEAPAGARYALTDAPLADASFFREVERDLVEHLYRGRTLQLLHNLPLDLWSRPGEPVEAFKDRCMEAAEDRADDETAALRERYEKKIETQRDQAARAERRVRELGTDLSTRRQQELVEGAGDLLGMFLGGRRRTRGLSRAASRRSQSRRTAERLESAEDRLRDEAEDVARLEEQLATELQEIWHRWQKAVWEVEQVEVSLEKNDIRVEELALFWAAPA